MSIHTVSSARIGIVFALPEETSPFIKQMPDFPRSRIAVSGAGRRSAARCVQDLIQRNGIAADTPQPSPLQGLILCGFAGGLAAHTVPGSIVIADAVLEGLHSTAETPFVPDPPLYAVAMSLQIPCVPLCHGALVTLDRVAVTRAEKQNLAKQTGAIAVDMETAGAVAMAQEQGIPWLAVRVITDGVEDDMPLDFNMLADTEGNVERGRVVRATLAHPWKIPALIRLGMRSSVAAKNLASFLQALLQALPEKAI